MIFEQEEIKLLRHKMLLFRWTTSSSGDARRNREDNAVLRYAMNMSMGLHDQVPNNIQQLDQQLDQNAVQDDDGFSDVLSIVIQRWKTVAHVEVPHPGSAHVQPMA